MNAKQVIKLAREKGWDIKSQKGSHIKLIRDEEVCIVPYHGKKDIPIGTLN